MYGRLSKSLQYLYFMRFGLLLWLFPLVFCLLDSGCLSISTRTLSRGIFVPEYISGYLCVAFFVIGTGCVALITARAVVINGVQRFSAKSPKCVEEVLRDHVGCLKENTCLTGPPAWLENLLANAKSHKETVALLIALLPSAVTFLYLLDCGTFERVPTHKILGGLFFGTLMAAAFWYVVNALYYFAYAPPPGAAGVVELGENAARTILLPRRWFWLLAPGKKLAGASRTLEDIETTLLPDKLLQIIKELLTCLEKKFKLIGYVYPDGRLYEAQLFALVAASGFFVLFWILYPLTAPRPNDASLVVAAIVLVILAWLTIVIARGDIPKANAQESKLLHRYKAILIGFSFFFCLSILSLWACTDSERFPTLASILLAMIILGWILGALAFWLDRHRVPVLTFGILLAVVPRMFHAYDFPAAEEHFVSTVPRADTARLQTPAEITDAILTATAAEDGENRHPLIIVTATGGGLHASAWTARVLRQLYLQLQLSSSQKSITDHILLISTVSGGSVGLSYYLQAIRASPGQADLDSMVVDAQCSSLEAVGWGLIYFDGTRAIVPFAPYLLWRSGGDADLEKTPLLKDRTWALRKAFQRNSADPYCWDSARTALPEDLANAIGDPPDAVKKVLDRPWYQRLLPSPADTTPPLTVGGLQPGAGFPAFTMNTTTVEAGNRFLLANYRVPEYRVGAIEGFPAESFVDVFNAFAPAQNGESNQPDLPLASAAQLSATFPYVSSAARIPLKYTPYSEHFVDGGYYDDDGTSSAIEFLRYALDAPAAHDLDVDPENVAARENICERGPVDILLIEIRNSADTDAPKYQSRPVVLKQGRPPDRELWKHSGLLQQLGFPLEGFWNAGHGSVTGRDRNGLDLLLQSHETDLHVHQIIFDDQTASATRWFVHSAPNPLSWSLTPSERAEVARSADPGKGEQGQQGGMNDCYQNAADWFNHFETMYKQGQEPKRCTVVSKDSRPHVKN